MPSKQYEQACYSSIMSHYVYTLASIGILVFKGHPDGLAEEECKTRFPKKTETKRVSQSQMEILSND